MSHHAHLLAAARPTLLRTRTPPPSCAPTPPPLQHLAAASEDFIGPVVARILTPAEEGALGRLVQWGRAAAAAATNSSPDKSRGPRVAFETLEGRRSAAAAAAVAPAGRDAGAMRVPMILGARAEAALFQFNKR